MPKKQLNSLSEIRVIGGLYRGRKIRFPNIEGLRPTPNRVRETLFNWLAPIINGAVCLDLFAGSGALSFEAISRGAEYCLMLDSSSEIVTALSANKANLKIEKVEIIRATFPYDYTLIEKSFNIVFIDPPFHKGLVEKALIWLEVCGCLQSGAYVYIESEIDKELVSLPIDWELLRDKQAGNVRYSLARKS